MPFVLGLIPARGGSKGIKDKNITPLLGKPLLSYTIEAAHNCGILDVLVISTDSQDIADLSSQHGLICPTLRPAHLSTDEAQTKDVLRYEIENFESKHQKKIDVVILLQPTAPLRRGDDIKKAYEIFQASGQDSLISCYNAESVHPAIMYQKDKDFLKPYLERQNLMRRQDMPSVYVRNGALYVIDRDYFMDTGRIVSDKPALYEMPRDRSTNIDSLEDLDLAEFYLRKLQ